VRNAFAAERSPSSASTTLSFRTFLMHLHGFQLQKHAVPDRKCPGLALQGSSAGSCRSGGIVFPNLSDILARTNDLHEFSKCLLHEPRNIRDASCRAREVLVRVESTFLFTCKNDATDSNLPMPATSRASTRMQTLEATPVMAPEASRRC
jgi:hypothetical protein